MRLDCARKQWNNRRIGTKKKSKICGPNEAQHAARRFSSGQKTILIFVFCCSRSAFESAPGERNYFVVTLFSCFVCVVWCVCVCVSFVCVDMLCLHVLDVMQSRLHLLLEQFVLLALVDYVVYVCRLCFLVVVLGWLTTRRHASRGERGLGHADLHLRAHKRRERGWEERTHEKSHTENHK